MSKISKSELLSQLQPYQEEPIPVKMVFDERLLVIGESNLYLIGEKFDHWEIFETIERQQILKIELKDNFLGQKLIIVSQKQRYELKDIPAEYDLAKIFDLSSQQDAQEKQKSQIEEKMSLDDDFFQENSKNDSLDEVQNLAHLDEQENFDSKASDDSESLTYEEFSLLYDNYNAKDNQEAKERVFAEMQKDYPEFFRQKQQDLFLKQLKLSTSSTPLLPDDNLDEDDGSTQQGIRGCLLFFRIVLAFFIFWRILT